MTDRVAGFGIDPNTNMAWYLEGENKKIAKVTLWNGGDAATAADGGVHDTAPLSTALTEETFGQINSLVTFDGETVGFKAPTNKHDELNVMVATGNGKVALIDAGHLKARGAGIDIFETTKQFVNFNPGAAVDVAAYIFDGSLAANTTTARAAADLANLGQIVTAELARKALADNGWLFAGGQGGVAVLAQANGKGFDGTALAQLKGTGGDYPGDAAWAWKQIAKKRDDTTLLNITDVRKLMADGKYLYILTRDKLQRLLLHVDTFKDGKLRDDDDFKTIVSTADNPRVGTTTAAAEAAEAVAVAAGGFAAAAAAARAMVQDPAIMSAIIHIAVRAVEGAVDVQAAADVAQAVIITAANQLRVALGAAAARAGDPLNGLGVNNIISDGLGGGATFATQDLVRLTAAAPDAATAAVVAGIPIAGNNVIDGVQSALTVALGQAVRAAFNSPQRLAAGLDEFYDMMLVKEDLSAALGLNASSVMLATSRGLIEGEFTEDMTTRTPAFKFTVDKTQTKELPVGVALRFDMASAKRGGVFVGDPTGGAVTAEGNLYVTALDSDMKYAAVYRFAVSDGRYWCWF